MAAPANIIPVVAKINYDADGNTFRLRVSTQVSRPDGTRYEVEIETAADLGNILNLLITAWTGTRYLLDAQTAMQQPSQVAIPLTGVTYLHDPDMGTAFDVGTADPADDLSDVVLAGP